MMTRAPFGKLECIYHISRSAECNSSEKKCRNIYISIYGICKYFCDFRIIVKGTVGEMNTGPFLDMVVQNQT
jgi:hypothetical protein